MVECEIYISIAVHNVPASAHVTEGYQVLNVVVSIDMSSLKWDILRFNVSNFVTVVEYALAPFKDPNVGILRSHYN